MLKAAMRPYSTATPTGTVTVHGSRWRTVKRTLQVGVHECARTNSEGVTECQTIDGPSVVLWDARHPPVQAPFDPEKKTVVILGSGWGSTSLLKSIDTDLYNVVSL
jgi:hypothetical protein